MRVPDDRQSSGRYRHPFDPIPSRFFSVKYYDHLLPITFSEQAKHQYIDFPPMTENGVVTRWGFSIFEREQVTGAMQEKSLSVFQAFRISLMVNRAAVPGYAGIEHCINTPWELTVTGVAPIVSGTTSVFAYSELVPVDFPVPGDNTPIGIDFQNLTLTPGVHFVYARIVGWYSAP